MKEDESATALREQWLGAKSIKSGENPACPAGLSVPRTLIIGIRGRSCPQARNPSF